MKHFNEYVGTIAVIMFDLLVALFVYLLIGSGLAKWFVTLAIIAFCAVACTISYMVVKYWCEKIKSKLENKKE